MTHSLTWTTVLLWGLLGLGLLVVLIGALVILPVLPDPVPGYFKRKGQLSGIEETARWRDGRDEYRELRLKSSSGLEVELSIRMPQHADGPRPLILILGGRRTGRDAVKLIDDSHGVAVAAISYPWQDNDREISNLKLLLHFRRLQRAILDTPPALMLAADYLLSLPEIDPQRVELVGVSLGAFFVAVPGALDTRFKRIWLVHGAGQPEQVLAHGLRKVIRSEWLRRLGGRLLGLLTASHHFRPEEWVGRISPRPVIVISARHDEAFPPETIQALHQALQEPSEVIWVGENHISPGQQDIIAAITDIVLSRVLANSATAKPATGRSEP